jgi:hypothetical protein
MDDDPVQESYARSLKELNGIISSDVTDILDAACFELYQRRPSDLTSDAAMLWKAQLTQLAQLSDRFRRALESRSEYGPRKTRRDMRRSGPRPKTPRPPQTLGELVIQKCGTDSEAWKNYVRLANLFGGGGGNDTPSY